MAAGMDCVQTWRMGAVPGGRRSNTNYESGSTLRRFRVMQHALRDPEESRSAHLI